MPNEKFKAADSTASTGNEFKFFELHSTVKVPAEQAKGIPTTVSSTSSSFNLQSLGSATVTSLGGVISFVVSIEPTKAKSLLSEANRILSGNPVPKASDPETR